MQILENTPVGTEIDKVEAFDADSGANAIVYYNFASNTLIPFSIDASTGQIYVKSKIDYEFSNHYRLEVQARNRGKRDHSTLILEIFVGSVNEFYPKFSASKYEFEISSQAVAGKFSK